MKKSVTPFFAAAAAAAYFMFAGAAHAQLPVVDTSLLEGDVKLACEAILCLSTGARPSECTPSIKRYFDITRRKWSDTVNARKSFLDLCPAANNDDNMRALVSAMSRGAGKCDAAGLNQDLRTTYGSGGESGSESVVISNAMPSYCAAYTTHAYTDLARFTPKYVGLPERGGFWVEPEKYEAALAAYIKRIEAEDRAARENNGGGA